MEIYIEQLLSGEYELLQCEKRTEGKFLDIHASIIVKEDKADKFLNELQKLLNRYAL